MRSCLQCGGHNRDEAQFCGHCGNPLPPRPEATPTVELPLKEETPPSFTAPE